MARQQCNLETEPKQKDMKILNSHGKIKKIIAVMSGKGGVGKSSVAGLLASSLNMKGMKVGVLDADITGPSIPKLFGINQKIGVEEEALIPAKTENGIKIISINLMLQNEDDPIIWRGPMISNVVKQFYEDVNWGDLDYLILDLPPGTGDVALTVMQSLPLDGLVVVTSPQEMVSMIVKKAIHMAKDIGVEIYGLVENMSYIDCPDCSKRISLFGISRIDKVAEEVGLAVLGKLPLVPEIGKLSDEGNIEKVEELYPDFFGGITEELLNKIEKEN